MLDWSISCRRGVPYNLLMHLRMAGGLSFSNPRPAIPVFFINPEWYDELMAHSNRCWRAVRML